MKRIKRNQWGHRIAYALEAWGTTKEGNLTWVAIAYFSARSIAKIAKRLTPNAVAIVECGVNEECRIYTSWDEYKATLTRSY